MPVSVYFQSVVFLILAAVALFASAGTLAIHGFWPYLAIFAAIILASLVELDPGLLRERMRPGGKQPPFALLDRRGARPRPLSLERQCSALAPGSRPDRGRRRVRLVLLGDGGEPVLFLGRAHPGRARPVRGHGRALRLRAAPGLLGRYPDYGGERSRARIVARGGAAGDLQPAVSAPSRDHGRSGASRRTAGLQRLCEPRPLAPFARDLVRQIREAALNFAVAHR
jgi:hypothetical protein